MLPHPRLASVGVDLAFLLFSRAFPGRKHSHFRRRTVVRRTRLTLELLESRIVPSAAITGTVWNDLNGDGVRQPGEPALAGQTVFLDLNGQSQPGNVVTTLTASAASDAISASGPGGFGNLISEFGFYGASMTVQGLPSTLTDVALHLDLTNNSPDAIPVLLVSPLDPNIPQVPLVFFILPGQHFVGTFDGNSLNPVTLQPSPVPDGTYAPQQGFNNPQFGIINSPTNGVWGLAFAAPPTDTPTDFVNPSDPGAVLQINSWSLTFTTPEPTAVTDAAGNYSFTGLNPGLYTVGLVHSGADVVTHPGPTGLQTVQATDGQTTTGVDFGVQPAPDLIGASFALEYPATGWGQSVTIKYTLTNQGAGDASAFDVDLMLSNNGVIPSTGTPLDVLHFDGLAAGASVSGTETVTLPQGAAPGSPPPGFGALSDAYVGFVIDPNNAAQESNTANNSNQGAGVDLAVLAPQQDAPVAPDSGVQQDPSIAVDPTDPQHLVTAYMDYSLLNTGYAGIAVAVSTDGGASWTTSDITLPAGFNQGAASPTVAFDAQGNVYVSFMAATFLGPQPDLTNPDSTQRAYGFQSNNGIFVAESVRDLNAAGDNQSGLVWNAPVAVVENSYSGTDVPFDGFPDLAVDTIQGSPYFGHLYVTWTQYYPPTQFPGDPNSTDGSAVMIAISSDEGAHWATQMQDVTAAEGYYEFPASNGAGTGLVSAVQDPLQGNNDGGSPGKGFDEFSSVTVGAGGAVYLAMYAGGYYTVFSSQDGGFSTGAAGSQVSGFTAPNPFSQTGFAFGNGSDLVVTDNTFSPDQFRDLPVREIVADPTHPGVVYAIGANALDQAPNGAIDASGVVFAVSDDYGQTWVSNYTVGAESSLLATVPVAQTSNYVPVLNDENGGLYPGYAASPQGQVIAGQAMPQLTVNAAGDVAVIWYDTRSDPTGQNLEVWGTISTDQGQHFSPNFQVSDTSFNPNAGAFPLPPGDTTGANSQNFYLGDQIGLASTNSAAYAVWTDTRDGRQQVYFNSFALTPAPASPPDRFAPNNTMKTATDLGTVTSQQELPRLTLLPGGDDEWFQLQAGASGQLTVTATAPTGGTELQVVVTDANGNVVTPTGVTTLTDQTGAVIGVQVEVASTSGQTYFVHVSANGETTVNYTLALGTLTADLGTQVQGSQPDATVGAGAQDVYRLAAGVQGVLDVTLSADGSNAGNLNLSILGADGQTVLASDPAAGLAPGATEQLSVPVTAGQTLFLVVSGANLTSGSGLFTLGFVNLDQYEATGSQTLFIPTPGDPTSVVAANLGGATTDLLTSNTDTLDALTVLKSNGDGTFQAPQEYPIDPGLAGSLTAIHRDVIVAHLDGPNNPMDVAVPNFQAGDVSVLLGNGDGTFQPQRIFNALPNPDSMVSGDFDDTAPGGGHTDLIALENFVQGSRPSVFAYIQGNGDGTFEPPVLYTTVFTDGAGPMLVGDFNGDGHLDLIIFSKNEAFAEIFLGNGDGTFRPGVVFAVGENTLNAAAVDLTGNGVLDLITTGANSGNIYVQMGNGDGTFGPPTAYSVLKPGPGEDISVSGLALVNNFNTPGLSVVVTAGSQIGTGAAEVIQLPVLTDGSGNFTGFGAPQLLATVGAAGPIAVGDFNGDGVPDLAVADKGGVTVIYGKPLALPPNTTPAAARDLGDADHVVTLPQAIVTGHEDAYFTYTVPTESVAGAGPEVIDFSALFQDVGGAGLQLQVTDLTTRLVLGTGDRFEVVANQGDQLQLHVFGLPGVTQGFGAYTLDIDVLPQVVSIQAESVLPGSPVNSLVLTLQGDQLNPTTAQDAGNYVVTWLGPNGDQVIPVAAADGAQPVIYDAAADVTVAGNGLTYPTSVRQTITLLFASPLPAGSYEISLSPNIQTAAFSAAESGLLVNNGSFDGHPLVSTKGGVVHDGSTFVVPNLVSAGGAPNPAAIADGTPFLTQLQNDLSALLNSLLQKGASDATITAAINAEIAAEIAAAGLPVGIIWLDPVSLGVQSPNGGQAAYSLQSNKASDGISQSYVSVGGNVELIVVAGLTGTFKLDVGNVPQTARGGAVVLDSLGEQLASYTSALRDGVTNFLVDVPSAAVSIITNGPSGPNNSGTSTASNGPPGSTGAASDAGTGPGGTAAGALATNNAALIATLLTGVPEVNVSGASFGNSATTTQQGNVSSGGQNSSGSSAAGGGGGGDEAASQEVRNFIDRVFLDLPDLAVGLADEAIQWGEAALVAFAQRIRAFGLLKSPAPPKPPMGPVMLAPLPADLATPEPFPPGGQDLAGAAPARPAPWRTSYYSLTLFLEAGLAATAWYDGLLDLAAPEEDRDGDAPGRKKTQPG